jgi:hypothetical protein
MDGAMVQIQLATVPPDVNGTFQVDLPDFSANTTLLPFQQSASSRLPLRDAEPWNAVASNLAKIARSTISRQ